MLIDDILILSEDGYVRPNRGRYLSEKDWNKIKETMDKFYKETDFQELNYEFDHYEAIEHNNYLKEKEEWKNYKKPKKHKQGFVYFIGSKETGIKIGCSINVESRLKTLNVASPFELHLINKIGCSNYQDVEKWAHEYFESRRMNSEWFDITEEEINEWIGGLTRG